MNLYGEELLGFGILLIIIVLFAAVVFLIIDRVRYSRLKKQLESEYGPESK